ncbi:hypothetical protein K2173_023051 [Erythroxylum novogranatense]|uniref:EF-hand domain-containing protein n=1 Tax=Erythroxylum novogranatense TaxID=1862640 RepID=A0AAV8T821_9ROSI|nr:hypothetical protein K2173_023051 [Erythroxylum novogranatense]
MAQPAVSAEIEALTQVLALVEAFKAFDSDNDGQITAAELGGILASLGYNASEQDVRAMMKQGDKNKDGLLSTEEFLELNTKDMELSGLAGSLKAAFDALDCDGDEVVTGEELFEVIDSQGLGLSLEVCQELIASMDSDGDGAVSCEDLGLIIRLIINAII